MNSLRPSPRMPVLFIGHGSPMNVITDTPYRAAWEALGAQFGTRLPRPELILCISAHWLTRGWWLTGQERPPTIHDFAGFPQALFDQQYPAPGDPVAAAAIAASLGEPPVRLDTQEWGFDHGAWSVLQPMFPRADIPVLQLSLNWDAPPSEHLAMGRRLRPWRDRGVLVVASGNSVHNLRALRRDLADHQAYDWVVEFDAQVARWLEDGDAEALSGFQALGDLARLAHPTHDHLLPLLYAAGAAQPTEPVRFFNTGYQGGSIAMRSAIWGDAG